MTFMSFIGPLLLAGLLHMEESYCMLYMPVYLVTIPSMYILLVIYSLFNLWNTGNSNFLYFAPYLVLTLYMITRMGHKREES